MFIFYQRLCEFDIPIVMQSLIVFTALFFSGCVYKGQLFYQGQVFDDGCDYQCECMDNVTGKYQCTEKYVHITKLVVFCNVLTTQANSLIDVLTCVKMQNNVLTQLTSKSDF